MAGRDLVERLREVEVRLRDEEQEVEAAEVQALLAEVHQVAEGLPPELLAEVQGQVDAMIIAAKMRQELIEERLDHIDAGRRAHKGYGQLRSFKKSQKLYKRA